MTDLADDPNRFDLRRIAASPLVSTLQYRDVVDSTQYLAGQLARRASTKLPALVLAREQTAGRGRGAARWWSPAGAVTFSLVVESAALGMAAEHGRRVSIATALAICEAVRPLVGRLECSVKWPNDVCLAGRKLSGVLVEIVSPSADLPPRMIVGVGVNVNNSLAAAPAEIAAVGTSLADATGRTHELTGVLSAVLEQLADELAAAARSDPAQVSRWQAASLLTGRQVTLKQGSRRASGRCTGIADDGSLLLLSASGRTERHVSGVVCRVGPRAGDAG